jgi:hypothetical protein
VRLVVRPAVGVPAQARAQTFSTGDARIVVTPGVDALPRGSAGNARGSEDLQPVLGRHGRYLRRVGWRAPWRGNRQARRRSRAARMKSSNRAGSAGSGKRARSEET